MVTEMTDKVCPLLNAANRIFLECVENQCAWYVDGACALHVLARNSHDVASNKQVTEPLRHNGFKVFEVSLVSNNQVTSDKTSDWISVEEA